LTIWSFNGKHDDILDEFNDSQVSLNAVERRAHDLLDMNPLNALKLKIEERRDLTKRKTTL